jgi:hypothetical protein
VLAEPLPVPDLVSLPPKPGGPRIANVAKIAGKRKNFLIQVWRLDARTLARGFDARRFTAV